VQHSHSLGKRLHHAPGIPLAEQLPIEIVSARRKMTLHYQNPIGMDFYFEEAAPITQSGDSVALLLDANREPLREGFEPVDQRRHAYSQHGVVGVFVVVHSDLALGVQCKLGRVHEQCGNERAGCLYTWKYSHMYALCNNVVYEYTSVNSMPPTLKSCGWFTHFSIATCFGVWTTALLWLVTRSAWVSVFILGACLGIYLLQSWILVDEVRELQDEARRLRARVEVLQANVYESEGKKE
jgi:hypothetical protein